MAKATDKKLLVKYEPSRYLTEFPIAGFVYYDGLEVMDKLVLGTKLDLIPETDNPYDAKAIAIYYGKKKLGYVPKEKNKFLHKLLYFGYDDILETRIQFHDKETYAEGQFRIVVKLKDNR